MKLGRTLILLWVASLTLFAATGIAMLATPELMNGLPGLAIRFFLGYCGLIVVAQVLAAMRAIRQLFSEAAAKKPVSLRLLLR
ncbi:MAG: hypothetical protein FDZ69_01700 [Deltaproteobacteria bacterium]|nr:MAG: hypothetical protein FDZ69_01700 [Deltaproteobacteria bacterium]